MGTKYIIEVEDKPFELLSEDGFTSEKLFRVKGFNSLVFDWNGLNMLTPYAEPDLEQVREEAYEQGRKDVETQFCSYDACKNRQEEYQRGLNDAWEAARKICTNWVLPDSVLSKIFGMDKTIDDIMKESTASEAIEKIRAYEQRQEEIKVGDEVAFHHDDGRPDTVVVVTYIGQDGFIDGMDGRGTQYAHKNPKKWTKTGRHFPEIATILEKMRGETNE